RQNISAVLIDLGISYIEGYKPAKNYQQLLYDKVIELLENDIQLWERLTGAVDNAPSSPRLLDIQSVFVSVPLGNIPKPARDHSVKKGRGPIDFAARDAQNRALGDRGEEFVINIEKARLMALGREDLSSRVEWIARTQGPEAGYDVKSFSESVF